MGAVRAKRTGPVIVRGVRREHRHFAVFRKIQVGIADSGGGSSSDAGYWASIALDGAGTPVAAHYDHGRGDLRVTRWDGTAFSGAVAWEGEDYTDTGGAPPTTAAAIAFSSYPWPSPDVAAP